VLRVEDRHGAPAGHPEDLLVVDRLDHRSSVLVDTDAEELG
jgi:hypothetical protein